MLAFRAGLLHQLAGAGDDDGVGRDEEGWLAAGRVRGFGGVDGEGLLRRGLEDVFEGGEGLGEVFGEGGGDDFDVCEADLVV